MDVWIIPFAYFTCLIVFNSYDIFYTHYFMIIHMRHTLWTGISDTNVNVITSATRTHAFNNNNTDAPSGTVMYISDAFQGYIC